MMQKDVSGNKKRQFIFCVHAIGSQPKMAMKNEDGPEWQGLLCNGHSGP